MRGSTMVECTTGAGTLARRVPPEPSDRILPEPLAPPPSHWVRGLLRFSRTWRREPAAGARLGSALQKLALTSLWLRGLTLGRRHRDSHSARCGGWGWGCLVCRCVWSEASGSTTHPQLRAVSTL